MTDIPDENSFLYSPPAPPKDAAWAIGELEWVRGRLDRVLDRVIECPNHRHSPTTLQTCIRDLEDVVKFLKNQAEP